MEFEEFLRNLGEVGRDLKFEFHPILHNLIRTLKDKDASSPTLGVGRFCPLTAVTYHLTGREFHVADFRDAGKVLGMDPELVEAIADAADMRHRAVGAGEWGGGLAWMRQRILETLNMEEYKYVPE